MVLRLKREGVNNMAKIGETVHYIKKDGDGLDVEGNNCLAAVITRVVDDKRVHLRVLVNQPINIFVENVERSNDKKDGHYHPFH